jgi:single-stranded-DNA-specific exonuclease
MIDLPSDMQEMIERGVSAVRNAGTVLVLSHIDADGITSMAIVLEALGRLEKAHAWRNIHQINSESIHEVIELIKEHSPDVIVFCDFGSGQFDLIEEQVAGQAGVEYVIILDHHIPPDDRRRIDNEPSGRIIEINPCQHGISGSKDLSGAGVSFLFAIGLTPDNADLSELAIVGATGDLQNYYGKGFSGLNGGILKIGVQGGLIRVEKDLTLFGINTRPLAQLLQYATDPYLPGLTGNIDACYHFYTELSIELKDGYDEWRRWVDLSQREKQRVVQKLIEELLAYYDDSRIATGLIGDVTNLLHRPPRSEMSTAKEFATLLNACGRNRRADIGVRICLGDKEAFDEGKALLQQHRANLAMAIRRIEEGGYEETDGAYIVNDHMTKDTIIGIVIGMAQGSTIIPSDKPVIGISTNTTDDSPLVKISGRARNHVVDRGVNLKKVFTGVADAMNQENHKLVVEAGGHPMAAGAFVDQDHLDEFIGRVSKELARVLDQKKG